jgi:uncharacterized membrane protein YeaQ/YmgE (transglycosylase-associated protein family)
MNADTVLGWVGIGAAASLAAMIWPFRRGAIGVVGNLVAGIVGAVAVALLSYLVTPSPSTADGPVRLFFAALGAIASLCLVHAAWSRHARSASPPLGALAGAAKRGRESRGKTAPSSR